MPNLIEQVAGFVGGGRADSGTPPDPEALVVLRAGANDYLDAPPSWFAATLAGSALVYQKHPAAF
jgi:hypothetical protein